MDANRLLGYELAVIGPRGEADAGVVEVADGLRIRRILVPVESAHCCRRRRIHSSLIHINLPNRRAVLVEAWG
jgi:hypothetical protein